MTLSGFARRRGGRSVAAVLAALLMASVLAVVAGTPVQAANTAYEVLVDHDGDASTDKVREFAGRDRYDTALRLAKNFAASKGGLGSVPFVFLSSGESLVDSVSAAGLAGYTDAPILLTPGDELPGAVADFIHDYGVGKVYVLGGPAAISDDVADAIMALENSPSVERIAGADRYETAAAAAAKIEAASAWCGSLEKGAILINGASEAIGFGVAIQTTAYRLQLPVLMTAADELPAATADFIDEHDIEHVQIIGGTDVVSTAVQSALARLGVDTVARTGGANASEVSVALAMAANDGCNEDLSPVASDMVVLVRGNPDGVAAAPVLASSLADGELVTPLIVDDSLPASVRDYLAATPKAIGETKLNLGIAAVGGTAAVSEATMAAAISAAASSGDLTAQIGATGGGAGSAIRPDATGFTLYFNDDVAFDPEAGTTLDEALLGKVRDVVRVNDVPVVVSEATAQTAGACTRRQVNVTLASALQAGDKISIVSSALKFGSGDDQRNVQPITPVTVVAAPPDRARPTVQIIGIAGQPHFVIRVSDNMGLATSDTVMESDLTFASGSGTASLGAIDNSRYSATGEIRVAVTREAGPSGTPPANRLVAGDRLTLKSGAVSDTSGNVNGATAGRAAAPGKNPRIVSVLMSPLRHSAQARWLLPTALAVGGVENLVRFEAKATGDAGGAAGNSWNIYFDRASTWMGDKATDIDVRVDARLMRAHVRFVNGPATIGALKAALEADSAFSSNFSVIIGCDADLTAAMPVADLSRENVAAEEFRNQVDDQLLGRTQYAIEVRFNAYIQRASHMVLLDDVMAEVLARVTPPNVVANVADLSDRLGLDENVVLTLNLADLPGAPTRTVRYEFMTAEHEFISRVRTLVTTAAGNSDGLVSGTTPAVAEGYDLSDVALQYNAASQVRIMMSNSVAIPPLPTP